MRELRYGEPGAIGHYRLVGVLGVGGMGQVFLGIGPDGRLAAIKQVLPAIADDPGFRARFGHEVQASRLVSGAYTAPVLDADPAAPAPWLASVFVPGPPLDAAVAAYGPLPSPSLRLLTVGLAIALREIHRVGLVHRDLKPSNVLLAEDGPRVIDFGIAQTEGAGRVTQTGAVIGSPGFMAPEQVEGHGATPATDVFALGAVLTHAVSGRGPFGDGSSATLMYRVAYAEPDLSRVPEPYRGLVAACLAKDPRRRPSVDQVIGTVGPVPPRDDWLPPPVARMIDDRQHRAWGLAGAAPRPAVTRTVPGPPAVQPPPMPYPARRPRSRRTPMALTAVAVLLVAALVAGGIWWLRPGEVDPQEAAALVSAVALGADEPPDGFVVADDPTTSEVDGAPAPDPTMFDRSRTSFACVAADPPTPAEDGIVAKSAATFREDIPTPLQRVRDLVFVSAAYLDEPSRTGIMIEIRGRIAECVRTDNREDVNNFRSSVTNLPGGIEHTGLYAEFPNENPDGYLAPQVLGCDFARVEAVVLRVCVLITRTEDIETGMDAELSAMTRELLLPLIESARREQGLG